jgi:hypothetical protein
MGARECIVHLASRMCRHQCAYTPVAAEMRPARCTVGPSYSAEYEGVRCPPPRSLWNHVSIIPTLLHVTGTASSLVVARPLFDNRLTVSAILWSAHRRSGWQWWRSCWGVMQHLPRFAPTPPCCCSPQMRYTAGERTAGYIQPAVCTLVAPLFSCSSLSSQTHPTN